MANLMLMPYTEVFGSTGFGNAVMEILQFPD